MKVIVYKKHALCKARHFSAIKSIVTDVKTVAVDYKQTNVKVS